MQAFTCIKEVVLYFENMKELKEANQKIHRLEIKVASMETALNIIQKGIEVKFKGAK